MSREPLEEARQHPALSLDKDISLPHLTRMVSSGVPMQWQLQDAKAKVEAAVQAKMRELTGGLPLPPGLKLF